MIQALKAARKRRRLLLVYLHGDQHYDTDRFCRSVKNKFHYAILVADRSEASCGPAASWNLAYHLAR